MTLTTAMLCMALNIYHESRGEPLGGQHAVAQVTFNRAGRDPDRVCEEVFKPKQFSWANKLTAAKGVERERLALHYMPKDKKAWNVARGIAYHTINGNVADFTNGAKFYHANTVRPVWRHEFKLVAVIGNHFFYTA
ncbi:MAG: cell wall hydrolase [Betaproteobacteria bacterium]|nr:cell wall hydrolase [Betaproteobacteria bacterium]